MVGFVLKAAVAVVVAAVVVLTVVAAVVKVEVIDSASAAVTVFEPKAHRGFR